MMENVQKIIICRLNIFIQWAKYRNTKICGRRHAGLSSAVCRRHISELGVGREMTYEIIESVLSEDKPAPRFKPEYFNGRIEYFQG